MVRKLRACLSQIEQARQAFGFGALHDHTAFAAAAACATLAGHQMAMESLHAFDLTRLGDFDPLFQAPVCFQLRHDCNPTEKKEAAPQSAPESNPKGKFVTLKGQIATSVSGLPGRGAKEQRPFVAPCFGWPQMQMRKSKEQANCRLLLGTRRRTES
jgi:hypothetical protein